MLSRNRLRSAHGERRYARCSIDTDVITDIIKGGWDQTRMIKCVFRVYVEIDGHVAISRGRYAPPRKRGAYATYKRHEEILASERVERERDVRIAET